MSLRAAAAVNAAGVGRFQAPLMYLVGSGFLAATIQFACLSSMQLGMVASFPEMLRTPEGSLRPGPYSALQSVLMAGAAVGGFVFGRISDRAGRLPVFRAAMAASAILALTAALAPSFYALVAIRSLLGAALGAALVVDFVLLAEFLPAASRGGNVAVVVFAGILGFVYAAIAVTLTNVVPLAEGVRWRVLAALYALPAALCAAGRMRFWSHESPLFLANAGRDAEADAVLALMCEANGVSAPRNLPDAPHSPAPQAGPLPVATTIAVAALYALQTVGYYGLTVWLAAIAAERGVPRLSLAFAYTLIAAAETAGLLAAAAIIDRGGRRAVLVLGFGISAASSALVLAVPHGCAAALHAVTAAAYFGVILVWTGLYVAVPEVFPTHVRARATGVANAAGKVAGVLSPLVLSAAVGSPLLIVGIAAVFATAAIVAVFGLRETLRATLS